VEKRTRPRSESLAEGGREERTSPLLGARGSRASGPKRGRSTAWHETHTEKRDCAYLCADGNKKGIPVEIERGERRARISSSLRLKIHARLPLPAGERGQVEKGDTVRILPSPWEESSSAGGSEKQEKGVERESYPCFGRKEKSIVNTSNIKRGRKASGAYPILPQKGRVRLLLSATARLGEKHYVRRQGEGRE